MLASFSLEQLHLNDQSTEATERLQKDAQDEEKQRSEGNPSLSFATCHSLRKRLGKRKMVKTKL